MADKPKDPFGFTSRNMKKTLWLALPVLLVFVSITSFIAGMNLSRTSEYPTGQMVDTIILSPNQKVQTIDISGQLKYQDGTPYAHQILEMHSTPVRTETDAQGRFTFQDIAVGVHTLFLLDENGEAITSRNIYVRRAPEVNAGKVEAVGVNYDVQVQMDSLGIYINLELTRDHKLIVKKEMLSLMPDGTVVNERGIVTGTAVDFSKGIIKENPVEETREAAGETEEVLSREAPEEAVEDSIAVITPGSSIALPGETEKPVETIDLPPSVPLPAESTTEAETAGPTSGGSSDGDSSGNTKPTKPTEPPTEPTEPAAPLDVRVSDAKNEMWEQNTTIDLFANRTGVGSDRKLAPGSHGSYPFQVANYNDYQISYTINMKPGENQRLVPLKYRLKHDNTYICGDEDTWLSAQQLYQNAVVLNSRASNEYVLEWIWPFEGGNDALDTIIGSSPDKTCTIIVAIQITQM